MCGFPYGMIPVPSLAREDKKSYKIQTNIALFSRTDKCSWSPINLLLSIHTSFTTEEKTSASVVSQHAKLLLGLSCGPSLQLRIWSEHRAFLAQMVLGKFHIE